MDDLERGYNPDAVNHLAGNLAYALKQHLASQPEFPLFVGSELYKVVGFSRQHNKIKIHLDRVLPAPATEDNLWLELDSPILAELRQRLNV